MALVIKQLNQVAIDFYTDLKDRILPDQIDEVEAMIGQWENIRIAAQHYLDQTKGTVAGSKLPENDQNEVPLNEFEITFDCCPLSADLVTDMDYTGLDNRTKEAKNAEYSQALYGYIQAVNDLNTEAGVSACSPELDIELKTVVNITVGGETLTRTLATFNMDAVGAVGGPEGGKKILLATKNLLGAIGYISDSGWVETCTIQLQINGGAWFEYPSAANDRVVEVDLPNPKEKVSIPASLSIAGSGIEWPTTAGGYIEAQDPDSGKVTGGLKYDNENGMQEWNAVNWLFKPYHYQPAVGTIIDSCPWYTPIGMAGWQEFVTLYHDHPLVTRENKYDLVTRTPEEETALIEHVNFTVNSLYDYSQREGLYWRFLGVDTYTEGDCEDFALTKAQWLLEAGFDISRIKIEGGWERVQVGTYMGAPTYGPGSAHAWLVIDDSKVMDLDNGATRSSLYSKYRYGRIIQKNDTFESKFTGGKICQWELDLKYTGIARPPGYPILEIEGYPHISIDQKMMELSGEIERIK